VVETADTPQKLKVFVSYSRKDEDFAEQLVAALDACGFAPYLDKQDVAPGEPWEQRLKGVNSTSRHSHFCHISRLDWIATLCVGSR